MEEKIRRSLREDFNTKQVEIESLKKIKEELQASQNTTKASMQTMTSEATKLQDYLDLLTHKKKELEDTKNAMAEGDTLDVDELVQVTKYFQVTFSSITDPDQLPRSDTLCITNC